MLEHSVSLMLMITNNTPAYNIPVLGGQKISGADIRDQNGKFGTAAI